MNLPNTRHAILFVSAVAINGILSNTLIAEPIYHPSGAQLTFGGMSHRQMTVSDMGNPAHPASIPYPEGDGGLYSGGLSIGLGIEYDGNDNFFKLLDQAGASGSTVPGDGGSSGGDPDSGEDGTTIIPPGVVLDPAVQAQLDAIVNEIAVAAAVIAVSVTGINAKAFVSADIPVLISNNTLGGAWTFGANTSITTNLRGLNDPINFSSTEALTNLQNAYNSLPAANTTETYDLSGGTSVTIDDQGATKYRFDNNSGVITRAAQVTEISIGYSRKIWQQDDNKAYIGVKPKYMNVGLSNTAVPIANIDKAKDIFDALDSSSFKYDQDFSVDLGAIWSGKQYQLGATLTNLNEPDFQYPAADLSGFTNPDIIQFIRNGENYVMERQLKFDAGMISSSGAWGINFGLDANAVPDPMGDDYQWASIGVGFASDNWWLPGARAGIRKNMAGSELTYVTAGITVFKILNIDLASTTQTVQIDGQTVPRGLIANLGINMQF